MKKISLITLSALLLASLPVAGQAPKAYKLNLPEVSAADPYTTLLISVVVEKETIKKGPYARFAQKYLGAIAPLTDKEIYTISEAGIGYTDPDRDMWQNPDLRLFTGAECPASESQQADFPKVNVDRVSPIEKSLEEQARDAANTIFTLRKRRFDLVSGEAGEYVFGEGLKAALQEMEKMEGEYLALFMGKQSVSREVRTIEVVPQAGKTTYIVCRFSGDKGLMPETDLSGTPVVLTLEPENSISVPAVGKGSRATEFYRVADFVQCTLSGPAGELARARIPVYQFGQTLPASSSAK